METIRHIVLFIHLIGFALLLGPWAAQALAGREVTRLMTAGMTVTLLAGVVLASPLGLPDGVEPNYPKIGVKLVILLVIGALLGIGTAKQRKTGSIPPVMFWGIGALTATAAGIAAIW